MGVSELDDPSQMAAFEQRLRDRMTSNQLGPANQLSEVFKLISKV